MKLRIILVNVAVILYLLGVTIIGRCAEVRKDPSAAITATVLRAYGGPEAVDSIKSVIAKGTIVDFLTRKEGSYARYYQRPGKLRIEVMPDRGGEIRILNGNRGWQSGPQGFSAVNKIMFQSMVYQYSYLDLPMGFADREYTISYGGKRQLGDRKAFLLIVNLKNAPQLNVFIDEKTNLIARVAANFAMGMMGSNELATEYQDFRPIRGVLFPHRLVNYAGSTKLSEIVLSDIQVNGNIPASLFSAPTSGN